MSRSAPPGMRVTQKDIRESTEVDFIEEEEHWNIPVISTSSEDGTGITELAETILKFNDHLKANQDFNRERELTRRKYEILEILKVEFFENILDNLVNKQKWEQILNDIITKKTDPYSAAKSIMDPFLR